MANVYDVANLIIGVFQKKTKVKEGDGIMQLHLQQLLYLIQGYSLAKTGKPFFNNDIEARTYGPVVRCIHDKQVYGIKMITSKNTENHLPFKDCEFVLDVLRTYKDYSTSV